MYKWVEIQFYCQYNLHLDDSGCSSLIVSLVELNFSKYMSICQF
jgi:hypothetical protein